LQTIAERAPGPPPLVVPADLGLGPMPQAERRTGMSTFDAELGGPPSAITSDHTGGQLDFIRQAIMALQHFAEQTSDDQELAVVHKVIRQLQQLLAGHAKDREAALGVTPALRHVRRASGGNY
jgi:hypothetical protein